MACNDPVRVVFLVTFLATQLVGGAGRAAVMPVHPGETEVAANGLCSLIEAVENAEADSAVHGDCPAGTGADLIQLPTGTYELSAPRVDGGVAPSTGLPLITSSLVIRGENAVIRRKDQPGVPLFRFVEAIDADLRIEGVTFRNGRIGPHPVLGGGAVRALGGRLTLERVVFEGNSIAGPGRGGALLVEGRDSVPRMQVTIRDSRFADNAVEADSANSSLGGGAVNVDAATLMIERCALVDNRAGPLVAGGSSAGGIGGAILVTGIGLAPGIDDTEVFVAHSTVAGNVARQGAAIAASTPTANATVVVGLDYVTIVGNRAVNGTGAGLWGSGNGQIQFVYGSSVIHGNGTTASARDCVAASNGIIFQSLFRNFLDPQDLCAFDPEEDVLEANLGLHLDLALVDDAYSPIPGGLLVNASGLNCIPGVSRDQKRRIRAGGPGVGGNSCEIGAIELHGVDGPPPLLADGFEAP